MADEPLIDRLDRIIDALVARADATEALGDTEAAPLARVAADLRHYPGREFTMRLRAQLERRAGMASALVARNIRAGFTTVTPYVWVPDRGLADFVVRVFDAVETSVADNPGHGTHRELRVGSSMLMIGETGGPAGTAPPRPVALHVFVENADAVFARALEAGGTSLGEPADRPYGERSGFIRDPYGNRWYIATSLGPSAVPEALRTVTPFLHAQDVAEYIDFLQRAFGAVEEARHEIPGGAVPYARVRIGDAAVEMGGPADPMPGAYFLYVADADAVYARALASGAKPLSPPADRASGDRIAFVEDPIGNHWYIASQLDRLDC
jgi:PhnB protein